MIFLDLDCSDNPNNIYFDNVRLVNALANSVEYDEDVDESIYVLGSHVLLSQRITTHDGIYTTVIENNRSYLPVRVTVTDMNNNSFVTVNKYDSKRNLIATQDYRGMVTLNEYTENGQLLRSKSYHSEDFNSAASLRAPENCFVKEYTYDSNGEFKISESDQRSSDICTLYDYNRTDGSLNHVTDPTGVRTTYAYDNATGALTMVSSTVGGQSVSVAYGYTNRLLTDITHNGFDYLFEYDGFGRQTQINIGGDMFAKNAYTLTDTTTVTTTYANNDSLTVTTDRHQAPISKSYTKSQRVTYEEDNTDVHTTDVGAEYTTQTIIPGYTDILITNEYDELGKLTKAIDNCTETVYNYKYNGLGYIEEEKRNDVVFKTLEYDRHNRLAETTINTSDETLVYTPIYETRDSDNAKYKFRKEPTNQEVSLRNFCLRFSIQQTLINHHIEALSRTEPIYTKAGRHGGGVYVMDAYRSDKFYFDKSQEAVLKKLLRCAKNGAKYELAREEIFLLEKLISEHTINTI